MIEMSAEESAAFLGDQEWVVLGTLDPDGSPWADVVPSIVRDGRLFFRVPASSRSERNIRRDARVCCTQDENQSYFEIRGVIAHGEAERIASGRAPAEIETRPDPLHPGATPSGEVYSITLSDIVSFDFARIRAR
ncbi:MAG: pyridoxamine 5'-phosphate oxidase family protein [Deltaproteobacteria bacterium]|nr:pyridoxamine 5'-phosphate oxidase family protein [Deltaproteobacteria bacterium]MBW2499332.1 pyridoxamine 5'-phosphate oxidase family protein [Deltaproteobacteria bacterium]